MRRDTFGDPCADPDPRIHALTKGSGSGSGSSYFVNDLQDANKQLFFS
jgi:hypothetical protein